jgi:ubiquinone/menaquinone biosynthesis C-methylase UbiE
MSLPFARSSFPEIYESALVGPLFRPWAQLMLEHVALARGDSVLDVACGTGIVARLAREKAGPAAKVVGVDVSPPMLAVAREAAPDIDWREGDAGALPIDEDEQFEVVVCQQGLPFFSNRPAAARQMRRALAPGGRLAVSTWCADDNLPALRELRRIAESRLGPIADRRHAFGEPGPIEALLREAGFGDVRTRTESRMIQFDDGGAFARLNALALVGMAPAAAALDEGERDRLVGQIAEDSADLVEQHSDDRGFAFRIDAVVATARG